jgi:glycosyltransferase involved in cell wall biosynthesis
MDLSGYDVVITSCSSFFARGFKVRKNAKVIAYCHTPPRFLYGYETSIDLQRYWPVRIYAVVVNHFLRFFDFSSAGRVDKWVANSINVQRRVLKFYRKESEVIYPPIEVDKLMRIGQGVKKEDYFLIVSRLVGAKGLVEAAKAAKRLGFKLKIVGESVGFSQVESQLKRIDGVDLLGRLSDAEIGPVFAGAKGFIALAKDEDFGMTPVEAMAYGTPVIAFNGGGFKETVVDGVTGLLIDGTDVKTLEGAMKVFARKNWDRKELIKQANKFSRDVFEKKMKIVIQNTINA